MGSLAPLPGEPDIVRVEAGRMQEAADRMSRAAVTLRRLVSSGSYISDAVDAFEFEATELATTIDHASTRYRGTGDALAAYAPRLEAAQRQADEAISRAGATDVGAAENEVRSLKLTLLNPLLDDADRSHYETQLARARADRSAQQAAEASAFASYEDARADLARAAEIAMSAIQDAAEGSGLNDTFADDFRGFKDRYLVPFLEAVVEVLDAVGKILGVIALVLAFVPGLQPLAAALATLSLVLTLVSLVARTAQMLIGERTIGSLLTATLLAIVTLGKAKLGNIRAAKDGKVDSLVHQMGFKDSARYLSTRADAEGLALMGGTSKTFNALAPDLAEAAGWTPLQFALDPVGYLTDGTAQAVGDALDDYLSPAYVWSTDDLATQDVSAPLPTDFSGVVADDIVDRALSGDGRPGLEVVCTEYATSASGGW